ncbi:hypothetical protein [Thermophilibacter sp.]
MSDLSLAVVSADGRVRWSGHGTSEVTLSWRGTYQPGDRLVVTCDRERAHMVMRLDACLAESHVMLVGGRFEFPIPRADERCPYGKGWAFADERHWAYVRLEDPREADAWRNLALNAHDLNLPATAAPRLYPHASTNVTCPNPQFFARNAIDGIFETSSHGSWPHESWGVNGCSDAWLRVDFGEPVVADELALYLRADFPHDTWWRSARLELSDGSALELTLEGTGARQGFSLGGRTIEWLRLRDLVRAQEDGFPALSQLEVWGRRAQR